jgi:hypothetical protein
MMCKSLSISPRFRHSYHGNGEHEGDIANKLQFKNALKFIAFPKVSQGIPILICSQRYIVEATIFHGTD